ncbi:MAG TPA: hypothetical protein VFJ30_02095, partial [Phycisphaerae bacterium]|nr:hypothetical protein [Phycisphaerae bacterium]
LDMLLVLRAKPAIPHYVVHTAGFIWWICPRAALSALSLVWGVLLLRHRRSARVWCIVHATGSLVLTVSFPLIQTMTGSFPPVVNRLVLIVGMITSSAIGAIWPVFLLVWFTRPKVRAHVRSWGRGASPVILEVPS